MQEDIVDYFCVAMRYLSRKVHVKTHFQSICWSKYLSVKIFGAFVTSAIRDFLTGDQRSEIRDRGSVAGTISTSAQRWVRILVIRDIQLRRHDRYAHMGIIVSVSLKSISSCADIASGSDISSTFCVPSSTIPMLSHTYDNKTRL